MTMLVTVAVTIEVVADALAVVVTRMVAGFRNDC